MKWRLAVSVVVAFPLLVAQQQASNVPGASQKIEVRVVNVDAHVTDKSGKPFLGLTSADFEVLEDGRPQPISNFTIVEKTQVRPAPNAAPQPTDLRYHRRVAVIVDNNYLEKRDRDQALATFEQFANETIGPDTEWSVGFIGERFELMQAFTSDQALLKAAVQKVRDTPVNLSLGEQRRELLSDSLRRNQAAKGADYKGTVNFANREQTYRASRNAINTARGIVEATRAYGQAEGKKVLFLITGGMELNTTFSAYDKGNDREVQDAKREVQRLLDDLVQEANSANVSIDVIAARTRGSSGPQFDVENSSAGFQRPTIGIQASQPDQNTRSRPGGSAMSQTVMNDPIDTGDTDSASFMMSVGTGGYYLTSNRVRDSFDLAESNSSQYYSLGYHPAHPEDGQYHHIVVKLKKPGYHLTHRQGYIDSSPDQELENTLRMRVSTTQPSVAVPVAIEVTPTANAEGKVGITATTAMKNINFLAGSDAGKLAGKVHIYLSIFDSEGKNIAFQHRTQDVSVPADITDEEKEEKFRYTMNVKIPPGEYTVAVTLRDDLSRDVGTAVGKVKL